jgi:hypothetical protein
MLDKLTRAIWRELPQDDCNMALSRRLARAALLAIREPSLDLGVIGAGPVNEHMRGTCKADVFAAQDAFTAMIDAILEEPSNG